MSKPMKQPRVPEYGNGSYGPFLHALVLFLKDFCMEAWREIENIKKRLDALEGE